MIEGKVWGDTQKIYENDNFQVSRIYAKKGGFCSKHKHQQKWNLFYVESGKLKIVRWKNDYDLVDDTILTARQQTSVPPGEYHLFEALEDTVAYEIYYSTLNDKDIIRENHGGEKDI